MGDYASKIDKLKDALQCLMYIKNLESDKH